MTSVSAREAGRSTTPVGASDRLKPQGLARYGCALLLAWTAGSGLTALVRRYSAQSRQRAADELERTTAAHTRRAEDRSAAPQVTAGG
jgi:hypothetical protein